MKSKVDKLDGDQLKPIPVFFFEKLNNVVEKEVVKKAEFNESVEKVNTNDTSKFVKKTDYNANAKIKDIEYKIPSVTNLATTLLFAQLKTSYQTLVT